MSGGGVRRARAAPRPAPPRRALLSAALLFAACCCTRGEDVGGAPPLHGAALERAVERWRAAEYALQAGAHAERALRGALDASRIADAESRVKWAWESEASAGELAARLEAQQRALETLRPELASLRAAVDAAWPPGGSNASAAGADEAADAGAGGHSHLAARFAALAARRAARPHATAPLPPGGFSRRYNISFLLQYYKHPGNIDAIVDALYGCTTGSAYGGPTDAAIPAGTSSELIVNVDSRGDAAAWDAAVNRTARGSFLTVLLSNNLHEVHGYNRAAAVARGAVLVLLQDDGVPPSSCAWVADLLARFEAFPRLGAVGLNIAEMWWPATAYAPPGTTGVMHRAGPQEILYRHGGVPFQFVSVADFSPYAVRATALHSVGGLDEAFAPPGDCGIFTDYELSMRLWLCGWQVAQMALRDGFRPGVGVGGTHVSERAGVRCWDRQVQLALPLMEARYSHADSVAAFEGVKAANAALEPAFEGPPLWEACCAQGGGPRTSNECWSCGKVSGGFVNAPAAAAAVA